jgi:hypothetical protein
LFLIFINFFSAAKNNFFSYSDSPEVKKARGSENVFMDFGERKTYVDMLQHDGNVTAPFSYVKHMNFLNFEEFNQTNVIYINFVRHPIDRVISWYYYIRQGWY